LTLKLVPVQGRFCGQRINGQVQETIIDVPFSPTMGGTCFEYSKIEEKKVQITWDAKAITDLNIELRGSAGSDWPFPNSWYIDLFLYVNDALVVSRRFTPSNLTATWATNIGAHIINGWNTFRAEISKPGCNAWVKSLDVYVWFQSNLIPKTKTQEQQLMEYLTWGAVGVGILGAVYLGIRAYEARKKG